MTDLVDKFYEINPAEDFFCPYAEGLQVGWRVLPEGSDGKQNLSEMISWTPFIREFALRHNQWGRVLCVTIDNDRAWVSLAYDDGITRQMVVNKHRAWLVKRDSVPRDLADNLDDLPFEHVWDAIPERTYLDDRAEMAEENAKVADEIAEKVGKKFEEYVNGLATPQC